MKSSKPTRTVSKPRDPRIPKPEAREFTVRDLNRNTAQVLAAARKHGSVTIQSRSGEQFLVTPSIPTGSNARATQDFAMRQAEYRAALRNLGAGPIGNADIDRLHRIIAGEE